MTKCIHNVHICNLCATSAVTRHLRCASSLMRLRAHFTGIPAWLSHPLTNKSLPLARQRDCDKIVLADSLGRGRNASTTCPIKSRFARIGPSGLTNFFVVAVHRLCKYADQNDVLSLVFGRYTFKVSYNYLRIS